MKVASLLPIDINSCVPKMTLCTLLFSSNNVNTPFQELTKILLRDVCVVAPFSFYECLQFSKELFNRIQVW